MRIGRRLTAAAVTAGRPLLRALAASWRFSREGEENAPGRIDRERPAVFVFWHCQILPLTWLHRRHGLVALISRHQDGEYISRVVESWGYGTARGSSTRGGSSGLRQLVRALEGGRSVAVSPDGPRGPAREVKPGALAAARLTGALLVPVAAAADRAWYMSSWDRFVVPRPFARIRVGYGEPLSLPRGGAGPSLDEAAAEIERRLLELGEKLAFRSGPA